MPSVITTSLNRPVVCSADAVDTAANTRHIAAVNLSISYSEEIWITGIIAGFRPVDPAQLVAPFPRLEILGIENNRFAEIAAGGSIFTFREFSKLRYYYDQFVTALDFRISDFFAEPFRLFGYQDFGFAIGLTAQGGLLAGYELNIEVLGEFVSANDKRIFPYKSR
jgi:hypothetical protein